MCGPFDQGHVNWLTAVSFTQFRPVRLDLTDSCSMKATPVMSATAAASEDASPPKKARAFELDDQLMGLATALSEVAPVLKLVAEKMSGESTSHESITQGLLNITEKMGQISESMKVTAEASQTQSTQPRNPILVRERAMRDLRVRLRKTRTMADELLHEVGQGPQVDSPLDEVRYEAAQEDACKEAVMEVATEFRRVMTTVNAGAMTEEVSVESLAQFAKALSPKRRLFGEGMHVNGVEVIPKADHATRVIRDKTSLAAWARATLESTEPMRRASEMGRSPPHEELHIFACKLTSAMQGPLKWSSRREWRNAEQGDPKWMSAEHMTMKEHTVKDDLLELDMSTSDYEEKAVRLVTAMSMTGMPIVINVVVAKTMWDVGDEATRQMIHDCFLYYFDGVKGAQFVSEVLDKRHVWKHLLMSRRMLSNMLQDDDTTMTGHIDRLTKKVDKLAEVMGRQQ